MANELAKRLNRLMEQKRLTVRKAASISGVPTSTLESWRSGSMPTDFEAIRKLCKELGVSMAYLLTGENELEHTQPPTLADVMKYSGEEWEGFLEVKIKRMIPKKN